MLALITNATTGAAMTLHSTWIRPDGTKAAVDPPRLLLRGYPKAGGVIRLWPDGAIDRFLGVAEGIESALSLAHRWCPAWACIDAGNLAALPVFDDRVQTLVVAVDRDRSGTGQRAAIECGRRWEAAGRTVRCIVPAETGMDINDAIRAGGQP